MKKTIVIAIIALLGFTQLQAQVTFRPGLRGGATFSHFSKGDLYTDGYYDGLGNYVQSSGETFSSKTDFYLGFYGALHLTKYYTLQPEVDYLRQGSKTTFQSNTGKMIDSKIDFSYLSIAVVNKFTFTPKFNVHVGPTLDIIVDKNVPTYSDVDLAFILGAGYNFNPNLGIEARVKRGIIPSFRNDYSGLYTSYNSHSNVNFSLGVTYTFDIK